MTQIYGDFSVDAPNDKDYDDFLNYLKEINVDYNATWYIDYDLLKWEQNTDHDDIKESLKEILGGAKQMNINIYGQIVAIGDDDVVIYRVKNLELEIIEI